MKRSRQGFTLIELLACMVVFAIVMALLFPVFARAREKGRQAACMSNARQLGYASSIYVQDYDETYPLVLYVEGDTLEAGKRVTVVFDLIQPYLTNHQITRCPSEPTSFDFLSLAHKYNLEPQPHQTFGSFIPNGGIFTGGCTTLLVTPRNVRALAQLAFPADQPIFYDGFLTLGWDTPVTGRHSDGMNMVLADGHTRFMKLTHNPAPTGVDPLTGKVIDQWYIARGPFRLWNDSTDRNRRNWMIFGLVTDPDCSGDVTAPCNINPPCQ